VSLPRSNSSFLSLVLYPLAELSRQSIPDSLSIPHSNHIDHLLLKNSHQLHHLYISPLFLFASADPACPSGFYYFDTTASCAICPIGSYCPGNNSRIQCSGAYYQDQPHQDSCKECGENSYTPNNVVCIPCRLHEYCPNGIDRISCTSPGEYLDKDALQCVPCPSGHFCSYGKKYECPAGHYVLNVDADAETLCLECPVGWYCPGNGTKHQCVNEQYTLLPGQIECRTCPEGYYTANTSVSCLQCSQNDYCPNGIFKTRCDAGTYFSPASAECLECDAGFYCIDAKRYACSPGTFSNGSRKSFCEECPPGTLLPTSRGESIDNCIPCSAGTYSTRVANSGSSCTLCPQGTWFNGTGASDLNQCIKCPEGYYQDQEGQTSSGSCKICSPGYISSEGSGTCTPCNMGTFSPDPGRTTCDQCRPGSFSNVTGSSSCTLCNPGTYNPDWGSGSADDCIHCLNGGSAEYGANSSATCNECTPGYYLVGSSCVLCAPGSYSFVDGAVECSLCPKGTYLPSSGGNSATQCVSCAEGSYSSEQGQERCLLCPAGTFSTVKGANDSSVCQPCPAGYTSDAGSFSCFACPPGTYAPTAQTPACIPCPMGSFSNSTNSTSCYNCAPGSYADAELSTVCKLCNSGTYNPLPSSISVNNCTLCPKGTYSSTVSATSQLHCKDCEAGTFCDENGMNEPKKCPKGTYSTTVASQSIFSCAQCPKGTYSSKEGAAALVECESCPLGRYGEKEGAVFLQECTWCDPGHYSTTNRATSGDVCVPCDPGYYSPLASSSCIACPLGTYNPKFGSANATDCIICPNSQTTRSSGSASQQDCLTCEDGYYMTPSKTCASCDVGTYYNPEAASTMSSESWCTPCGKGSYQPLRTQIGSESCKVCPVGTYAPLERNAECTPCGKGFYSSVLGAQNQSVCTACPAGTWGPQESADTVEDCLPCAPGTSSNATGASSSFTCKLCPQGWKSESSGSVTCVECEEVTGCFTEGNSFELPSSLSLQDSLSIFDPKSLSNKVDDSYLTLKLSIPFGVFGFFLIVSSVGVCCLLIAFRCRYRKLLRKLDFFFPMKHYVRIGSSQVKRPSSVGGVLTIMVVVAFLGFFASILMDFIINNTIVLENFLLENSESVVGEFTFEAVVVGKHKTCDSQVTLTGFTVGEADFTCESGIFTNEQLEGCRCLYNCKNCAPTGNSHQILFDFQDYLMSPKVIYSIQVPHYVPEQRYVVNGSMHSGNSIFSGNDLPHTFSFSLNNARYVAISSMAAVIEILGIQQETITKGYTIQMTGKFPGSSQPNDEDFVLSEGMQILFDIQQSFGTYVSKETVRQNLFTFFAQVLTILSMLTTIGAFTLVFLEKRIEHVQVFMGWKEKPEAYEYDSDRKRRRRKRHPTDEGSWYSPHKKFNSDTSEDSAEVQAGEEMPRSVEPFFLQKWRQQRKNRIFSSDSLSPANGVGVEAASLETPPPAAEFTKSLESMSEDLPGGESQTISHIGTDGELPRAPQYVKVQPTTATYKYDPRAILEEMEREEAALAESSLSASTDPTSSHRSSRFNIHLLRNSFVMNEDHANRVPEGSDYSSTSGGQSTSSTNGSRITAHSTLLPNGDRSFSRAYMTGSSTADSGEPVDDSDNDSDL